MPFDGSSRYGNADVARRHLEALLWPDRPACPHCKADDKISVLKGKSTRTGVHWCNACHKPFSVTVGTVFENSKTPLNVWLHANHLLCGSKSHISGHRLARMLGVTYKTAWYMARHIREAMKADS
jgi:transposase-like protein